MGIMLSTKNYESILRVCASQPLVKEAVLKNHDDNLWWPLSIKDWRIRMIVAGLGTRISYNMIGTFRKVVSRINSCDYEKLAFMPEKELKELVRPIGLTSMRVKFWHSMADCIEYLERNGVDVQHINTDDLIELIKVRVYGSAYKVAQCCALYVRGYYCGIMPVDSGMFSLLCPAIGLSAPNAPYGYEVLRKQLEALTISSNCRKIVMEEGYDELTLPGKNTPLTWWAHLVLIYYKRFFSRKDDPAGLPLRTHPLTRDFVTQIDPELGQILGGINNVILEGLDGAGKTEMADMFVCSGFRKLHFKYNPDAHKLYVFYRDFLDESYRLPKRFVWDRSFVSEIVYGPIYRGKSRLSEEHLNLLLEKLKQQGSVLVLLNAPLDTLLERRTGEDSDRLKIHYSSLMQGYESAVKLVSKYIPVIKIDSRRNTSSQIFSQLMGYEFVERR